MGLPAKARSSSSKRPTTVQKARTGITGLDEITFGGLPRGRPTLVSGEPGCGKTVFAMEFLVHGARLGEPGIFVSFEETAEELLANMGSFGFDLPRLIADGKLAMEYVRVERHEIEETGEYDLEGLFVRLAHAIDRIGAKRIVLDTIESLFAGLSNASILRAELRRLFHWLKDRGMTAIITGERTDQALTRQGLEEYVSDCVIVLDHRVHDQVSTRRIRVMKYRGSPHGTNEYPFIIGERGVTVLPVTSLGLEHLASTERISTGIRELDGMLSDQGFFRGTSILVSGGAGTGKSSIGAHFAEAACRRGERAACFLFEESPSQFTRNMRSIGIDLEQWVRKGRLQLHAWRPTLFGLEMHLATIQRHVDAFEPAVVVVDPLSDFEVGSSVEVRTMFVRLVDFLKTREVTAMFTSLIHADEGIGHEDHSVSSLMDSWLLVRNVDEAGSRSRALTILKARGMAHSADVRHFVITDRGVRVQGVLQESSGTDNGRSAGRRERTARGRA